MKTSGDGMSDDQLVELYRRAMGGTIDFTKHAAFVVRQITDGRWVDCTGKVGRSEALRIWAERTDGGTHHVPYLEIDYHMDIHRVGTEAYYAIWGAGPELPR